MQQAKHAEHGFNWLSMIPGFDLHHYGHVLMAGIIVILVLALSLIARIQLSAAVKREDEGLIPDQKLTLKNFFEIIAEKIYGLAESVMGKHDAERFFPIVGALFIFIFVSNFVGLIPGLLPPTDNLNTTLALGFFVFLYFNFIGIKENGLNYFKHFLGPVWYLAWLIGPIEIVSMMFRPISLALRLRGNIMGDHVVLGIFSDLVPVALPIVFYGLGVFVAFLQAFVFCLMTMVYISLSTSHEH